MYMENFVGNPKNNLLSHVVKKLIDKIPSPGSGTYVKVNVKNVITYVVHQSIFTMKILPKSRFDTHSPHLM